MSKIKYFNEKYLDSLGNRKWNDYDVFLIGLHSAPIIITATQCVV